MRVYCISVDEVRRKEASNVFIYVCILGLSLVSNKLLFSVLYLKSYHYSRKYYSHKEFDLSWTRSMSVAQWPKFR